LICFDEYHSYPGWNNSGEYRAFKEFILENNYKYQYLAFGNMEAIVKLINNN